MNVVEFGADAGEATRLFSEALRRLQRTGMVRAVELEHHPGDAGSAIARLRLPEDGEALLLVSPAVDPDAKPHGTHLVGLAIVRMGHMGAGPVRRLLEAINGLRFSDSEIGQIRGQLPLTSSCWRHLPPGVLADSALVLTIHHMTDFIPMVEALLSIGADRSTITIIDKEYPYALTHRVDAHLRDAMGLAVFRYSELAPALEDHIARAQRHRRSTIVLDDGGYVLPVLFEHFPRQMDRFAGLVEQTMSGITRIQRLSVPIPVFSVAESRLKSTVEAYGIADAAIRNAIALMPHEKLEGQAAVVIGYGRLGRQMADVLRNRRMRVGVYDRELVALVAAHESGFVTDDSLGALLRKHQPLLVVGTAGADSLTGEHIADLTRDCFLVSVTSRDYEFSLSDLARSSRRVTRLGRLGTRFELDHGPRIVVLAHGFPINFHYAESLPNKYADIVLAAMVTGAATLAQPGHGFDPGLTHRNLALTNDVLESSAILREYYDLYGPGTGMPPDEAIRASTVGTTGRELPPTN